MSATRAAAMLLGGGGLGLLLGCVNFGTFACERDSQCELNGQDGRCFDPGYCALPDAECPSGYRYHGRSTPSDLSNTCVVVPPPATGTGTPTGPVTVEPSSSSGGSSSSSSSSDDGSSDSSDASSSTTSEDCGEHPCPCASMAEAGLYHTCVTRLGGDVVCWGRNQDAQLGMGMTSMPIPSPQALVLPPNVQLLELRGSNNHTCGRTTDGEVWCWGQNDFQQSAPGVGNNNQVEAAPLSLPLEAGVIGLGPQATCVASVNGPELYCVGDNSHRELGGAMAGPGPGPYESTPIAEGIIEQLAIGEEHMCLRSEGRVWCRGRNQLGQLGDGTIGGNRAEAIEIMLHGGVTHLSAGSNHTCAAVDSDPNVVCWGSNASGQLGDGTLENAPDPTPLVTALPAPVVQLDAIEESTCALLEDGSAWCWGGASTRFILGTNSNTEFLMEPMQVVALEEIPEPLAGLTLGYRHICAYAETGRLWCWGQNTFWQLGPSAPPNLMKVVELDLDCALAGGS